MITYEEFLTKCKDITSGFTGSGELEMSYHSREWLRRQKGEIKEPRLIVTWSTGGVSGGSCWDSSNPKPYTSNDLPEELEILDTILTHFYSQMSFLQYRVLSNTLVKYDTYSVGEYYGNCTDYAYKTIDIRSLYDYMVENNLLKDE